MKRLIFASLVFSLSGCCLHAASLRNIFVEQALNQLDSARRCVRTLLGSSSTDPADALSSARTLINQALSSLQNVESRLNTHDGPSASQPPTANRKRRRSDVLADNVPLSALMPLSRAASSASLVGSQEEKKRPISNATRHTCGICKKSFEQREAFRRHMRTHAKKNFRCDHCRFGSNSQQRVEEHQRRRHGKSSERISDLRSVSREGQGEQRPASKRRLLSDQDVSSLPRDPASRLSEQDNQALEPTALAAEPLHRCAICPNFCGTKEGLYKHNKNKHEERKYRCSQPGCDKEFVYQCHLNRHLATGHQIYEVLLRCGYCERSYGHRDSIKKHLSRRHKNLPEKIIRVPSRSPSKRQEASRAEGV